MPRRYSYKMTWAVLHNVNINYIPGNNSYTQNQSRNPLHYSMLSWTNSIGSCTLLWKKIKNSSFLWVTVMPGFFMSVRLLILIFVIIYPKVSYWWIGTSLWKQKQFLKLAHDTVKGSMWETSLGIHQIVKPIVHSGGGGPKKKNFFLNQIYFEIGMFIYIVSSRVYNCAYLWL